MRTLARAADRDAILDRLGNLRLDSPRLFGRMSAHQMVCHVCDAFLMALGERTVTSAAVPLPRAVVKGIALYMPFRWRAGVLTSPEIDQHAGGTRPLDFARDVAELAAVVRRVTEPGRAFAPTHPVFGRMSGADWLRWGYLHTDHHLRQFGA
jgi:hypothetical protein